MKIVKISMLALMSFSLLSFTTSCDDNKGNQEMEMMENMLSQENSGMMGNDNTSNSDGVQDSEFASIMSSYIAIKYALIADDESRAQEEAEKLVKKSPGLERSAKAIAETDNIEKQREYFSEMSTVLYQMAKNNDIDGSVYWNHCPMALNGQGANWLSQNEKIQNPYMGQKMPGCGSVQETITN
ncbi:DUF3347 domain-containing protein [Christiangramia sp.]|uniref:DUF3347 domain-containing protein n=1 Tax=Christiangramia sp. TaxID=1931228 RepID=UPI00260FF107|nr:DUF3347 domain-containing protein [Christiangramia sp.]